MIERAKIDNFAVLTGDVHSSWAYDLPRDPFGGYDKATGKGSLGVEFAGTSVTSPSNLGRDGEPAARRTAGGAAASALRRRPLPRLFRRGPDARAAAGRLLRGRHDRGAQHEGAFREGIHHRIRPKPSRLRHRRLSLRAASGAHAVSPGRI